MSINTDATPQAVRGPPELPGRSFLTQAQREFLAGDVGEFNAETRRQYRYQIRRNFQSALVDLKVALIMDGRDQELAAKPSMKAYESNWDDDLSSDLSDPDNEPLLGAAMVEGIRDLLAWYFLHLGSGDRLEDLVQHSIDEAISLVDEDVGEYTVSVTRKPPEDRGAN